MCPLTFKQHALLQAIVVGMLIVAFVLGAIGFFTSAQAGDTRLGIMPSSHHFTSRTEGDWNEDHHGIFAEARLSAEGDWLGIGSYDNSVDETSVMIYGVNDVFFTSKKYVDFGIMYGGVTGYDIAVLPFIAPTANIKIHDNLKVRGIWFYVGISAQLYLEF